MHIYRMLLIITTIQERSNFYINLGYIHAEGVLNRATIVNSERILENERESDTPRIQLFWLIVFLLLVLIR